MKRFFTRTISLLVGLCLLGVLGCNRTAAPPAPLASDQLVPELQKGFANAKQPTKELVGEIVAAVQTNDFAAAFQKVQLLSAAPDVNKKQRVLAARAMLTINSLLQAAQAKGDPGAAAAIKAYQRNK
jgi:hypothetical protein